MRLHERDFDAPSAYSEPAGKYWQRLLRGLEYRYTNTRNRDYRFQNST